MKADAGFEQLLRQALVTQTESSRQIRTMLNYSLFPGGKRLRPSLCLFLAKIYGARSKARNAALALELFHNFTLIHDDIADADTIRRNKPTLWKKYSVNLALNAGDALSLIACQYAAQSPAAPALFQAFSEVIEGQQCDLSGAIPSAKDALIATEKKTGALFGAAAESAGLCARRSASECQNLREFGRSYGTAFQLQDDYRSIWSTHKETGKDAQSDIRERKRTLPFFFARAHSAKLEKLYSLPRQLTRNEIQEAQALFDASDARTTTLREIQVHIERAQNAANKLDIGRNARAILMQLASA